MNILLSAFACEPCRGSEPEVGWNYARITGRKHNVTVLTEEHHKKGIQHYIAKTGECSSVRFIYIKAPMRELLFKKSKIAIFIYSFLWQIKAYFTARKLCNEYMFDIVHHVTYCVFRIPSFMFLLGIPFVWGPLGGGESAPHTFYRYKYFGIGGLLKEYFRIFSNSILKRSPVIRRCAAKSSRILVTTCDTAGMFSDSVKKKIMVWPVNILGDETLQFKQDFCLSDRCNSRCSGKCETECDTSYGNESSDARKTECTAGCIPETAQGFNVVYAGQLLAWKGVHLALLGFARFAEKVPDATFTIIGKGNAERVLRKLAGKYFMENRISFKGWLDRKELFRQLADGDVFLFPSLHDSSPLVVAEAMLFSLPVICLNLGGPGFIVNGDIGIKIDAISQEQVINDIAAALYTLYCDKGLREKLSEKAGRFAMEYSKDSNIEKMLEDVYESARQKNNSLYS